MVEVTTEKNFILDEKDIEEWIKSKFPEFGDFEITIVDSCDNKIYLTISLKMEKV